MLTIPLAGHRMHGRPLFFAMLLVLCALWPAAGHARAEMDAPARLPAHDFRAANGVCSLTGAAPANEEDRRLVSKHRRLLTGRSQRQGDTYVAEAVGDLSTDCAGRLAQLYLFRDGVLLGPATPRALPLDRAHFRSFTLLDPEHLRYVVSDAAADDSRCAQARSTRPAAVTTLVKTPKGWSLRLSPDADVSYQARTPVRYPTDGDGHRHQGKVVIHVEVDKDGFPSHVTVAQTSTHPELDQAAIASVRRGCFDPAQASIDVPVRFSLHTL